MGWVLFSVSGCSVDSARSHYVLAEKLWMDRKYAESVSEFEKVVVRDPKGKLGLQALYRAAVTQSLFLSQYHEAIRKFRAYVAGNVDLHSAWDAQIQIGDIFFSKTDLYEQAITHYQALLKERPSCPEAPEFHYRIAKSWFFLFQFDPAIQTFREVIAKYAGTPWAEKAMLEIGTAYFTRGEQVGDHLKGGKRAAYEEARKAFQAFIVRYPQSELLPQAKFGIASCLEEQDELESAYQAYEAIKSVYPSPQVVEIKLARIRERMAHRSATR